MGIYDRSYYRDEGLPRLAPWDNRSIVTILIFINVGLFVANFVLTNRSSAITEALMVDPQVMHQPLQWYRIFSYGFAHTDRTPDGGFTIFHLLFNMASLYFLGRSVEERYGRWEFLRIYLIAVLLGGLYWTLRTWAGGPPMLGASGAVTAISMLFVFNFPRAELLFMGVVPMPAWVLGVLIIVGNMIGGRDSVAYDVHLVGAAFAAIYFYGNWNFSFLEEFMQRTKLSYRQKQRGFKVHRPEEPEPAPTKDEAEADRILAKIHQQGQDSLTAAERKFMEAYSRRVRERRAKSD